ncbi:hypothetical protein WJX84_008206 [Apatococcus fuscideae]|uniref:Uncharacterized protein n=1 Tax=Apatococcus fuscideae TaxID=2026836 RepID=A0AAW1T765_9CHLO
MAFEDLFTKARDSHMLGGQASSSEEQSAGGSFAGMSARRHLLQYTVNNVDATYYGQGNDARSWCKGNGRPYGDGSIPTVALGPNTFNNGAVCGQCIIMTGTGRGAGFNPVSTSPTKYLINNLCPECGSGVDMAKNGDGRWQVDYYITSC